MDHINKSYQLYHHFQRDDRWRKTEWIEADGLGGWSSQACGSLSTRRYHSILTSNESEGRFNYISQLEEFISHKGAMIPLSSNIHPGAIHPEGYKFLETIGLGPGLLSTYRIGEGCLTKELLKEKGKARTLIKYTWQGESEIELHLTPLFSYRGFHSLQHAGTYVSTSVKKENDGLSFQPIYGLPPVYSFFTPCRIIDNHDWFYRFQYEIEKERGLDYEEDLFSLNRFIFKIAPGKSSIIVFSMDSIHEDLHDYFNSTVRKNSSLLDKIPHKTGSPLWHLSKSAKQCIINTPRGNPGIVAGYHWFEEWGRDTFISLPYLLDEFSSKEEIYQIFTDFLKARKNGLIPNRFFHSSEGLISAEYNSIDALLWLGIAAHAVYKKFRETSFIQEIYPMIKNCCEQFQAGTDFGIRVQNGLLLAGNKDTQLTWMDAKVQGIPVTPRSGAAVEINAGWYNLQMIMAEFSKLLGNEDHSSFQTSAENTLQAFRSNFLLRKQGYLADVISESGIDTSFRPNQLFSISMPFSLLEQHEARTLLFNIQEKLLTPCGLRTLAKSDPKYISHFNGNPSQRDSAYHQGTVWPWLLIPYWEGVKKFARSELQPQFEKIIEDFTQHLNEGCLGSVSEVFDGEEPYHFGGTASQAWSIAALLFCIKDLTEGNL